MTAPRYSVVAADLERDRSKILAFWQRIGFSSADRADRYDWFHLRGPDGQGRIYLLLPEGGEQIVGTACAGTRWICLPGGRRLRASVLVDFAVDPAHRSVGPALLLQRTAREREMEHADLLYGLPDTKAVPIFKRLGCDQLLQEASYAYVVRTGPYLQRKLPAWAAWIGSLAGALIDQFRAWNLWGKTLFPNLHCTWSADAPPDLDALWAGRVAGLACGMGVRDRQYLGWRFSSPDWRFAVVSGKRDSEPLAYMACRRAGDELLVGDLLLSGDSADQQRALRAFLRVARKEPVKVIRLDLLAPAGTVQALNAAGFSARGERPCFIVRNAVRCPEPLVTEWWMTKADEDV